MPVPQLLLHVLHADHDDVSQCTGHASVAQERSSASGGHT
jgi:hypothetical protein